jgi:AraC-like DNA-binding protein
VQKAVWFVESHFRETVTLEEIAQTCGVSAYHLTRTFATSMGIPLMRYVRARRLSEAARQLIQTKANIVDVALETGYGSHEAFTQSPCANISHQRNSHGCSKSSSQVIRGNTASLGDFLQSYGFPEVTLHEPDCFLHEIQLNAS